MADPSHFDVFAQGVVAWNEWREQDPSLDPDLSRATLTGKDLTEADLSGADLSGADLSGANLTRATFTEADLSGAELYGAKLSGADLSEAALSTAGLNRAVLEKANLSNASLSHTRLQETNFCKANLEGADLRWAKPLSANFSGACLIEADLSEADASGANFSGANLTKARFGWTRLTYAIFRDAVLKEAHLTQVILSGADLSGADLSEANLERVLLIDTNLDRATLTKSSVHGVSAWNIQGIPKDQTDLIITREGEPTITVDDLEVAQFVYLLFDNRKLRNVIQTMTSKAVLILGNFDSERKEVLEAIREQLRKCGYLPMLFDFDGPESRDIVETVTTVARLSRFVIADLTHPRMVPADLQAIVPFLTSLPVQTLINRSEDPYSGFSALAVRNSVLPVHRYTSVQDLLESFNDAVITPAEDKFEELKEARVWAIKEKL